MASYWTKRRRIVERVREHLKHAQTCSPEAGGSECHSYSRDGSLAQLNHQARVSQMTENISSSTVSDFVATGESTNNGSFYNNALTGCWDDTDKSNSSISDGLESEYGVFEALISEVEKKDENYCNIDSDSELECDQNYEASEKLQADLCSWVSKNNISMAALGDLLCILRKLHPLLPKDPRTLLKTPQLVRLKSVGTGSYYHFGIVSSLTGVISELQGDLETSCCIQLQVNVDGLPLFKSSGTQFWPILGRVSSPFSTEPFVIGIYCGKDKPGSIDDFLQDFVTEMQMLQKGPHYFPGLGVELSVNLSCFICDTPARAFLKQVKSHTGYYGCDKCTQKGWWDGKMTFPEVNASLRTDVQFDEMAQAAHHTGHSPLQNLSVGMVSQFPLDYMHLVCLGVTRRLLWYWTQSPVSKGFRLGRHSISQISQSLVALKEYLPREFPRKCRCLAELDRWKATEFRQFLLYSSIVVLKGNLSQQLYLHFLQYFVAIKCLSDSEICHMNVEYANELLSMFVSQAGDLYGKDFIVYNVHGLIHIAQDVKNYGPLDAFSAFPFENYLSRLKKLVQSPRYPLQQVVKRLTERKEIYFAKTNISLPNKVTKKNIGPLPHTIKDSEIQQFKEVQYDVLFLSVSKGDNCVQISDVVCLIRNIFVNQTSEIFLVVERFSSQINFFNSPLDSTKLNIFKVSGLVGVLDTVSLSDIQRKLVLLPYKTKFVSVPLAKPQTC